MWVVLCGVRIVANRAMRIVERVHLASDHVSEEFGAAFEGRNRQGRT